MHMHAYACICMQMHAYACICMHMHAYACICMQMHACACICMHLHAYACTCMHSPRATTPHPQGGGGIWPRGRPTGDHRGPQGGEPRDARSYISGGPSGHSRLDPPPSCLKPSLLKSLQGGVYSKGGTTLGIPPSPQIVPTPQNTSKNTAQHTSLPRGWIGKCQPANRLKSLNGVRREPPQEFHHY